MIHRPNQRQYQQAGLSYTVIPHVLARDRSISPQAKNLLLYMLTLPPKWQFYVNQLARELGVSRSSIETWLKELKEATYVEIVRVYEHEEFVYRWEVFAAEKTIIKNVEQQDNSRKSSTKEFKPIPFPKAAGK